ncbi:uncharacterized protein N7483_004916 [Penicillium malachiteum]|uniref:uncharacterized protein n=1 Tax=Penicillium malachiteum TaxID=1324776 RepID=UPI002547A6A4|nr:uncharacterized protein N7483_004916 [Penicillium malachiteum]KAJ5730408.1 hypothetical protein N7483_004916 [Penicillium malachiteum]
MATSIISRGSDTLDIWPRRPAPKVDIDLVGQKPGLVNSYTSGDRVEGVANITVDHETRFDEIEIILQGNSSTLVERVSCPGRTGAQHMFLKLRQPIEDSEYPTPRVLEAGRTYKFPFMFVVPDHLLPQVCTHPKKNNQIHRAHTMLPPTLGDPMISANGKTLLDDMAPSMSQIAYIIRVGVMKKSSSDSNTVKALANVAKKIRIIPTMEEEPPIDTVGHTYYRTRNEKTVKRGFLRGKQGQMVAEAAQPKPIRLFPLTCGPCDTVSTVAKVQLRFEPMGDEQPPRLGSMTSKLKSSTFYGCNPWEDFPSQSNGVPFSQVGQGLFNESSTLSTMCVAAAQWEKQSVSDVERRDSVNSTVSNISSPSASFSGDTYYTASLLIPVSLPNSKVFVPTFHSCLMSRVYSLDLNLTYHTPGANGVDSVKSSLGIVVTQDEVDEFFRPRLNSVVTQAVIDVAAPPEYSETIASPNLRSVVQATQ